VNAEPGCAPDTAHSAFVEQHSIVRRIWGDPDLVLLIFAGSAAEFAVNRAVDWLFFTNALPQDPIGRLFSTVLYAQRIIFAPQTRALDTLASISAIHAGVERARGRPIPDWAYRDVLYMLIAYSQRAHELLEGPLHTAELEELFVSFLRVGRGLHIPHLPETYEHWREDRERHLERNLAYSDFTKRLFEQYRRQLGPWRYQLLLEIQALLVPERVRELLKLRPKRLLIGACVQAYSVARRFDLQTLAQRVLIPEVYWSEIEKLKPATQGTRD
jgi:uncharacterized protein (DUF2236 family)